MTHHSAPLNERVASVQQQIADAAREAGREPGELTTIVITKFHPASLVRELAALGMRDIGENRHQEAQAKAAELTDVDVRWHFVGQLQRKKARAVRAYADVIHSIDRDNLVDTLASDENDVDALIQLNLTDDPGRGGVRDEELDRMVEKVLGTAGLRLRGVMAVAPLGEDPRSAFARVRAASERVRTQAPDATWISAGMSGDFREAIWEGATHLRIGTAITGNRPEPA